MKLRDMPTAWDTPLPLVEIAETPTTLTVTQTKAAALRDLRTLLIQAWHLPFTVFAFLFAYLSESSSSYWNHGEKQSLGEWYHDPFCLWTIALFSLGIGRSLLPAIRSLLGRATFVFDKDRNVLLRNGRRVGLLGEICAIKAQINKGLQYNPVFRLMLELPQRRKVVVAVTHFVPGRGDFRVSRYGTSRSASFVYLHNWLDYDKQDYVPFLDPEIAEIERRITRFLAE